MANSQEFTANFKKAFRGDGIPEVLKLGLCRAAALELAVGGEDLLLHVLGLDWHEAELRDDGGGVHRRVKVAQLR